MRICSYLCMHVYAYVYVSCKYVCAYQHTSIYKDTQTSFGRL